MKAKSPLSFLSKRKSDPTEAPPDAWDDEREPPRFEAPPDPGHGTTRDSIGPLLRQTRESFGYDLQRISQALRIRYLYLDAIEKGNFERLPGPAYAVGFIRSYADFLGLDSEKILEFYKRDVEVPVGDSGFHFPEPVSESKVPGIAIISLCLILAAVAYGSWYYASQPGTEVADIIPEVPERLKIMLEPEATEVEQAIADATAESDTANVALPAGPETGAIGDDGADTAPVAAVEEPEGVEADAQVALSDQAVPDATAGAAAPEIDQAEISAAGDLPATDTETNETASGDETSGDETIDDQTNGEVLAAGPTEPQAVVSMEEDEISALINEMVGGTAEPVEAAASAAAPDTTATDALEDAGAGSGDAAAVSAEAPATENQPVGEEAGNEDVVESGEAAAAAGADDAARAAVPEGTQLAEIPAIPGAGGSQASTLAPDPQVYGATDDDVRVVLRALADCWVQVREESGNLLLSRVLRPGDTYQVPDKENLTLLAGNAGGLQVLVDGRALPPLGPAGKVRRDVSLNVDALLGGTANLQ